MAAIDFSKARVLVIGDLMLDRYFFGNVSRISPEAPVPVVKVTRTQDTLGGAGNVAHNLAHLGAEVCLVGHYADDEGGKIIESLCSEHNIKIQRFDGGGPTIVKTRVIGEHQQVVRIDFEDRITWQEGRYSTFCSEIETLIHWAQVVIISDYAKGMCADNVCQRIIGRCGRLAKTCIVDPKGSQWDKYKGAGIVTPNVKELAEIAHVPLLNDDGQIAEYGEAIRESFGIENLLVTRSEKGMSLLQYDAAVHFPTEAQEVFDVSGAGDTVVATLAAAIAAGHNLDKSVVMANKAAGIVVSKIGTAPIELYELQAVLDEKENPKLLSNEELIARVAEERQKGHSIVFTNGVFDLLHRGHVHLLKEAKKQGDVLVIALNSDSSTERLKGVGHPLNTELDRAHLVGAIQQVDLITIFDADTPIDIIQAIRPDVLVKGGTYQQDQVLGREFAKTTVVIPPMQGYSTRELKNRVQAMESGK